MVRLIVPLYFPIKLVVDEALYGIVLYGEPIMTVFTSFSIYIVCDHGIEVNYIRNVCWS